MSFGTFILSPLGLLLGVIACFLLLVGLFLKRINHTEPNPAASIGLGDPDPKHKEKGFVRMDLSLDELKAYNGKNESTNYCIFVALDGYIFDVTIDKKMYGVGGHYESLAGKDASRAFATFSLDPNNSDNDENDLLSDLNPGEIESLKEWRKQFEERYQCVGKLLRPYKERFIYDHSDEDDAVKLIDLQLIKECDSSEAVAEKSVYGRHSANNIQALNVGFSRDKHMSTGSEEKYIKGLVHELVDMKYCSMKKRSIKGRNKLKSVEAMLDKKFQVSEDDID